METLTANDIFKEFIKLNDTQKKNIIDQLTKEGVDNDSIEAMEFLAVLSSKNYADEVFSSLYENEARILLNEKESENDN